MSFNRGTACRVFVVISLLGAAAAQAQVLSPNLVYTSVQPCRVFDTRGGGGPIAPGAGNARTFNIVGNNSPDFTGQGGHPGGCNIPGFFTPNGGQPISQAQAVVINLIAVNAQGAGDLRAWPSDQAKPAASVLNYAPVTGLNIANAVVVPLKQSAQGGDITIQADVAATDVVGDVAGYFSNNVQTNTVLGLGSLQATPPGLNNTAFGNSSLAANTGDGNTAIGGQTLPVNTTGANNTAVGFRSLASLNGGSNNTALGGNAMQSNTSGSNNVAIGNFALDNNVSGSNNVAIGFSAGENETGSNKLYIANSAVNPPLIYGKFDTQQVGINTVNPQATLTVHGTAQVDSLGNGTVCSNANGLLSTCVTSDARLKRNVVDLGHEIDLFGTLAGLRGVAFSWDPAQERARDLGDQREIGFLAQEVERVLPEVVSTHRDGYKSVDYSKLSALLVEVVKAQKARLEAQQTRIEAQQRQLDELAHQLGELTPGPASRQ
jgi:hypothetical protein